MAKIIYNKNVAKPSDVTTSVFSDEELKYGEIVLCNSIDEPGIYIFTKNDGGETRIQKVNSVKNIVLDSNVDPAITGGVASGDSLSTIVSKLQNQINNISGSSESESEKVGKIVVGVGLNDDGTYKAIIGRHVADATSIADAIAKLSGAIDTVSGETLAEANDVADTKIQTALSNLTANVNAGDGEVFVSLVQANGVVSGDVKTLSMVKSESGLNYQLKLGDYVFANIDIPQDQFLSGATFITAATVEDVAEALNHGQVIELGKPYLKFVWKLEEGVTSPTYVDVSALVNVYTAKDIKLSDDYTGNTFDIKSGTSVEDAIGKVTNELTSIEESIESNKVASSEKTINVTTSDTGTNIDVNIDNDTIVKNETVTKQGQLSVALDVEKTHIDTGYVRTKYTLKSKDGEYGVINDTRDVFVGDETDGFIKVETQAVSDSEGNRTDKITITPVIQKTINNATGPNVDDANGLVTAWGVKEYVRSGIDGDGIMVGDDTLQPYEKYRGHINFDSSSIDYDTVHKALYKTDNNMQLLDEALGFESDGQNVHHYPSASTQDLRYISGATTVMEALKTLDETLDVFSSSTFSALTQYDPVSDKETIIITKHDDGEGTSFDVNIHSASTSSVSMTNTAVVAADKNFLEQTVGGDKGLKVTGMDSDVTVTTAPIKILGWNDNNDWVASGVYKNWDGTDVSGTTDGTGINYIPKGTSIQEILENILSLVLYPNAATKPTFSVRLGSTLSGVKEIYSSVIVPGATLNKNVGKFNASYTNVSQPTPVTTWSGDKIITTKTGFTDYVVTTGATTASASATVALGENKVTYTATSTYSAPSNNPVRNDNEPTTKTGKTASDGTAIWVSAQTGATNSVSVTGVWPVYDNIVSSALATDATHKLGFQTAATVTITNVPGETSTAHFMFDFPADRSVTSFKVKNLAGVYVEYTGTWTQNTTVTKTINGHTASYKRLTTTGAAQGNGVSYQITLNKSLNQ